MVPPAVEAYSSVAHVDLAETVQDMDAKVLTRNGLGTRCSVLEGVVLSDVAL